MTTSTQCQRFGSDSKRVRSRTHEHSVAAAAAISRYVTRRSCTPTVPERRVDRVSPPRADHGDPTVTLWRLHWEICRSEGAIIWQISTMACHRRELATWWFRFVALTNRSWNCTCWVMLVSSAAGNERRAFRYSTLAVPCCQAVFQDIQGITHHLLIKLQKLAENSIAQLVARTYRKNMSLHQTLS